MLKSFFRHDDIRLVLLKRRLTIPTSIAVAAILLVATLARLSHLLFIQMDLLITGSGSGGLFLAFAGAIADNGYRLPPILPHYTDGGIPFAYPPLSFHLEAILVYALGLPSHLVVNGLPPLLSLAGVASFHILTGALNLRPVVRLLALFVFAISEAAVSPHLGAGGLAEAMGTLTLIWMAIGLAWTNAHRGVERWHFLAGAALGLCVTASPGSAYGSIVLFALYAGWQIVSGRGATGRTLASLLLISLVGFVVSAFYTVPVLVNHGFSVLIETFANEHGSPTTMARHLVSEIAQFTVLWNLKQGFFVNAAVALGMLHELVRRRWLMAVWLLAWLIIPREGGWMAAIPASILAGVGIRWVFSFWLQKLSTDGQSKEAVALATAGMVCFVTLGLAGAGYMVAQEVDREYAPEGFVDVLARTSSTLPEEAKVITLMGGEDWSPFLIQRDVLNMRYGAEWQPGEEEIIESFEDTLEECRNFGCVYSLAVDRFGYTELYFIARDEILLDLCKIETVADECQDVEIVNLGDGVVVGKLTVQNES